MNAINLIFLMNSAPQCEGRVSETLAAQDPKDPKLDRCGGGRGPPLRHTAGDRGAVGQPFKIEAAASKPPAPGARKATVRLAPRAHPLAYIWSRACHSL